ncbi:hypothetical protein LJK88_02715 [Paenibacillus sp. P26]|nr:hypothetical protein LJK88_02715 [Paenibacillus sp. P26]UUZ90925.1 hypothetical protein LJK87_34775 [Paenibacillus sp. P25]
MPMAKPHLEARVAAVLAARDPHTFITASEPSVTIDFGESPGTGITV